MPNIQFNYCYRDYANYKNYGEAIFSNPDNLSVEHIDATLRANLLDGEWLYAIRWGLKDLHFEKYDDENDHPYHEYIDIELTEATATDGNVTEFLERVIKGGNQYYT